MCTCTILNQKLDIDSFPEFPAGLNLFACTDLHFLVFLLQNGLQELLALVAPRLLVKHASLDNLFVHIELEASRGQDLLLHGVDGHQSQHPNLVLLADSVGAVLSLQIL